MEDTKKGEALMPDKQQTSETSFHSADIKNTKSAQDNKDLFVNIKESRANKRRQASHKVATWVGKHHKFVILMLIAITLIAVAAFMLSYCIPKWMNGGSGMNSGNNDAPSAVQSPITVENSGLNVQEITSQCGQFSNQDDFDSVVACWQSYIDANSDTNNARKAALYTGRANQLLTNAYPRTNTYNRQILSDYEEADKLNPTIESANNMANTTRLMGDTDAANYWNGVVQERISKDSSINTQSGEGAF